MYIAFETLPSNDPRLDKQFKIIGDFWHYTIAEVPNDKYIEWLSPVKLPNEEKNAWMFAGANGNEITIKKQDTAQITMAGYSADDEELGEKMIYYLSPNDIKNTISFLKKVLSNYAEKNLSSLKEQTEIKNRITSAKSISELKEIMFVYYDTMSPGFDVSGLEQKIMSSWTNIDPFNH